MFSEYSKKIDPMKYLLVVSFLVFACFAQAQYIWESKIDEAVWQQNRTGSQFEYFVLLKTQAKTASARQKKTKNEKAAHVYRLLKETANNSQSDLLQLIKQHTDVYKPYFMVNGIWVRSAADLMETLAKRNDVWRIAPNPIIENNLGKPANVVTDLRSPNAIEWGVRMINADFLWANSIKGAGVVVGGQDTGYEWYHPAIKTQYRGDSSDHNYHWHDAIHGQLSADSLNACGYDVKYPCDDGSHGTHTMGTIVGDDGLGNQIGVAPEADWIGCRNMENGYGTPTTYIECFEWFLAPTDTNNLQANPSLAPHVIANSWGCPPSEGCNPSNFYMMQLAIENLKNAGTFIAVSAGNDGWSGCNSIRNPAAIFEASFSVGASDVLDTLANFSSRGYVSIDSSFRMKPNVTAPGVNIRSCVPGNAYANYSGTSMAGPHVTGAVALLISAQPSLAGQVDSLENLLEQTADTIYTYRSDTCGTTDHSVFPNNMVGYGRINLYKALQVIRPDLTNSLDILPQTASLSIFPNPFTNIVQLKTNQSMQNCTILIVDALGKVVKQMQGYFTNHLEINLVNLPNAVYYIHLNNGKTSLTGKLIKQ
jgi:subtilisin family serine protease